MTNQLVVVTVVRDWEMYQRCISSNRYLEQAKKCTLDNSVENLPIPVRYNSFIDERLEDSDGWIMFCHEDFCPREEVLSLLGDLKRDSIYGAVGSRRIGAFGIGFQQILGGIEECNRDGSGDSWIVGRRVVTGTPVETLDCCCLIIHASLIKQHQLRFDESLAFDLYIEDFCATAFVRFGVRSRVLSMDACHYSGSKATERLFRHLPYLEKKYPRNCFSATCVYFGARPILMRIEDWFKKVLVG